MGNLSGPARHIRMIEGMRQMPRGDVQHLLNNYTS